MIKITIRQAIVSRIADKTAKEILLKIPNGYSIKQAVQEAYIDDLDGSFLAVFISANREKILGLQK